MVEEEEGVETAAATPTRGDGPGPNLLLHLSLRLAVGVPIMALALPGLALWSPVMVFMRIKQEKILRRRGGIEQNADELAELKVCFRYSCQSPSSF